MAFRSPNGGKKVAVILAVLGTSVGLVWYSNIRGTRSHHGAPATYIDPAKCSSCHSAIHRDYQHVGMAASFRSIANAPNLQVEAGKFFHAKSDRQYEVVRRDGRLFQRRVEHDAGGREANAFELEVTHSIGSGNHARSYLHRMESGEFVQLPLTWYSQEKSWGMSPGYDNATPPDFIRIVDENCLSCHNGYTRPDGTVAEGIDCQRCHGPGSTHVNLASASKPDAASIRSAIVNPKRLSPALQTDICMQCHLETTSAELPPMLRKFDRAPLSFRPGEPLGSYVVHFDHPPKSGHDDKFEIVNQAYRLRQSRCFLESSGRLTCTSCHNPHRAPRGETAVSHYRAKCVACHASVTVASHPDLRNADCVACHMPRRRAEDAVHVVMTDHLIQRRRPAQDLTRPMAEHPSSYQGALAIYYPDNLPTAERDIYLGAALISGGADRRRGIAMLEKSLDLPAKALAILGEGYLTEGNAAAAIQTFERALAKDPELAKARYNLGRALESAGRYEEARSTLQQAIVTQPRFPEAEYALANVLVRIGEKSTAVQHYQAAIRMRPIYAEARNNLGNVYAADGRIDDALSQLEQALRINPAYAEAHNNLARVYAMQNRVADALVHARRAVELKPDYSEGRYNLARLLQETGASSAALAEYRKLLAMNPTMVEAHLSFGQALGDAGQLDAAIAEFQEVLRLRPGHAEAQGNLQTALSLRRGGR